MCHATPVTVSLSLLLPGIKRNEIYACGEAPARLSPFPAHTGTAAGSPRTSGESSELTSPFTGRHGETTGIFCSSPHLPPIHTHRAGWRDAPSLPPGCPAAHPGSSPTAHPGSSPGAELARGRGRERGRVCARRELRLAAALTARRRLAARPRPAPARGPIHKLQGPAAAPREGRGHTARQERSQRRGHWEPRRALPGVGRGRRTHPGHGSYALLPLRIKHSLCKENKQQKKKKQQLLSVQSLSQQSM